MGKTRATRGVQGIPKRQMNIRIEEASVEKLKGLAAASGESLNAAATRILEEGIGRPAAVREPERVADPLSLYGLTLELDMGPGRKRPYAVACWAPKGGTGNTSIAVGTAHYISWLTSRGGYRTLLVDFGGDAYMQSDHLRSRYATGPEAEQEDMRTAADLHTGLKALGDAGDDGEWDALKGYLAMDPLSGLYMLLPPAYGSPGLDSEAYAAILDTVGPFFDFIVFDCGQEALAPFAIARSDRVLLVGDQTFPAIISTVKYFSLILKKARSEGLPPVKGKYAYVVNRYDPNTPSPIDEIRSVMEKFVSAVIDVPDAHADARKAICEGTSLVFSSRKDIKLAFRDIVAWVLEGLATEPESETARRITAIEE